MKNKRNDYSNKELEIWIFGHQLGIDNDRLEKFIATNKKSNMSALRLSLICLRARDYHMSYGHFVARYGSTIDRATVLANSI